MYTPTIGPRASLWTRCVTPTDRQSSSTGCGAFVSEATPRVALILAPTRFFSPPARMGSKMVGSVPLHRAHNERHTDARCTGHLPASSLTRLEVGPAVLGLNATSATRTQIPPAGCGVDR